MKTLYAYQIDPVDTGWEYFITVKDLINKLYEEFKRDADNRFNHHAWFSDGFISQIDEIIKNYNLSLTAAKKVGWEGDMRGEPVIVPIVNEVDCYYGFMWKQDSKGVTYVVLPQPAERFSKSAYNYEVVKFD